VTGFGRHRNADTDFLPAQWSVRAEWINGDVATSSWPGFAHQQAARRVANLLERALPDLVVATAVTLLLSPDFQPIPDVVVTSKAPDGPSVAEAPLVVVEVVSPDTWATDAVVKSAAYHRHGIGQYWLVQPSPRSIHVFEHADSGWQPVVALDDARPVASLALGRYGTVGIDLTDLLGDGDG
jgi:Uma2 family endonuclease